MNRFNQIAVVAAGLAVVVFGAKANAIKFNEFTLIKDPGITSPLLNEGLIFRFNGKYLVSGCTHRFGRTQVALFCGNMDAASEALLTADGAAKPSGGGTLRMVFGEPPLSRMRGQNNVLQRQLGKTKYEDLRISQLRYGSDGKVTEVMTWQLQGGQISSAESPAGSRAGPDGAALVTFERLAFGKAISTEGGVLRG